MILRNADYVSFVKRIRENDKKIIVYGAGMIGQIIVPYLISEYQLYDRLECFVDADLRKKGQAIEIDKIQYKITTPDYLDTIDGSYNILISNSKFFPVVRFLDAKHNLDNIETYIIPMMQIYDLERLNPISVERKTERQRIPKKIHYCWFGGKEMPSFLQNCIASWKNMCPDYEIIEWNEQNYDVNKYAFTKEAYENKKYGFVTDLARLDILYEHGGVYMDTDVTLLKNLDVMLFQEGFIGTEKWGNINTGGGCGFVAGHPMLKTMLEYRKQFHFVMEDGTFNLETNGVYETRPFLERGFKPNNELQVIDNVTVYPSYIQHPYDYMSCQNQEKSSTVSMHHFFGGWMEEEDKLNRKKTQDEYECIVDRMKNL